MTISGFTFVRNAIRYDYPVKESIQSILPIVDEFIVSVGNSEDGTRQLIESIASPKIKIVDSLWDDSLRKEGRILAVETDKAFAHVNPMSDWAFYIQADEVVHEKYLDNIKQAASRYLEIKEVEGLLFKYLHFYGTYNYTGDSRRWYAREIRMIRNDKAIHSWKDAQGFRKQDRKLNVKLIDAYIYHYGWVRHPKHQQYKMDNVGIYWSGNQQMEFNKENEGMFDYLKNADSLVKFSGTHPLVMKDRISANQWELDFDLSRKNMSLKDLLLYRIEKWTGKRLFDYRNYRLI